MIGDFVLQKIQPTAHIALVPNWEGPYRIKRVVGAATYILETLEEDKPRQIPRAWNGIHLKKYYQ